MAYSIDTYDLPTIRSYEDAVRVFTDIKPIRGGSQSVRRIGKRSDKHKTLVEEIVDGVKVYKAQLWCSTVVQYYPTHYEISMSGWATVSTMKFIDKVSPACTSTKSKREFIPNGYVLEGEPDIYLYYNGYPIGVGQRYKFAYGSNVPLEPLRHPVYTKYAVDRTKMAEVRRRLKPFVQYVKAMHGLTQPELFEHSQYNRHTMPWTKAVMVDIESGNLKDWETTFNWLYSSAIIPARSWRSERPEAYCDLKVMLAAFDNMIKECNPQLLKAVAVTTA
jgi:hypothetical protein